MTTSAVNSYQLGDPIRITGTWTDIDGTATDPTGAIIAIVKALSIKTEYGYLYNGSLQGAWDADANSPALADGSGSAGQYYTVSVAGSQTFGGEVIAFTTNDYIYYDGSRWRKLANAAHAKVGVIVRRAQGIYDAQVGPLILYLGQHGLWVYSFFATESDGSPMGAGANSFMVDPPEVDL